MRVNARTQAGLTLTGLILTLIVVALVAVFGMRVVPDVIEYWKILKAVKAVADDPALKQASVTEVRKAYDRRADIDQIESLRSPDLEITKEGGNVVVSFAYSKRIHMGGPVSVVIDFEGSSAK